MKINLFTSTPDWVKRVLLISIAFACCWTAGGTFVSLHYKIKKQQEYPIVVYRGDMELKLQESKSLLVDEVDAYIKKIAPTSNLNARILVELCDEYDIDIKFALAQGQIESHYATKGLAKKTNSVFNVLAYDGKSFGEICKKGKYSHPDHSIEPYLKLICNDYLVDGKTEYDLLDNYVNKDGNRYASAAHQRSVWYSVV
jgi:hypothetical protein